MKYILMCMSLLALASCSWFKSDEKISFDVENPKSDLDIKIDVPDQKPK